VAQLYPRALGFLCVASYDSQGSGGGILTRLHTGLPITLVTSQLRHPLHSNGLLRMNRPTHFTPQKHYYFSDSGTHFC
jgi:hypothetical protein